MHEFIIRPHNLVNWYEIHFYSDFQGSKTLLQPVTKVGYVVIAVEML